MQAALVRAFSGIYGPPQEIPPQALDEKAIARLQEKYASAAWTYGEHMHADCAFGGKFPWGEIEVQIKIKADRIIGARIFSDCMDAGLAEDLARRLEGVVFRKDAVLAAVDGPGIYEDIYALFERFI